MNDVTLIRRETDVIRKIRNNFGVSNYMLTDIVKTFGEDLRISVELGYNEDAIAWDLFSRWQESKENGDRAA